MESRRLKVRYLGDVVFGDQIGAKGYDLFNYDEGSIVVGIVKSLSVVKSS